jgi:hypothetical protein
MKSLLEKLAYRILRWVRPDRMPEILYLKSIGYEMDFLWHIDDVFTQAEDYDRIHGTTTDLTDKEAEDILYNAVNRSMCGINDEILSLIGDKHYEEQRNV